METAFLNENLEKEMFMKPPKGFDEETKYPNEKPLRLNKSIYDLVQAALQCHKRF